jgi:hypothetical protein
VEKDKGVEQGAKLGFWPKLRVKWVWSLICAYWHNFLCLKTSLVWDFTLLILSSLSLRICILSSYNLFVYIWVFALEHKNKDNKKRGGRVLKAQAFCILKESYGGQLELECMWSKREGHFRQFLHNPKFRISKYLQVKLTTLIKFVWEFMFHAHEENAKKKYKCCTHDLSLWGAFILAMWSIFVFCTKFYELLHYRFIQSLK